MGDLEQRIRAKANELGFCKVGFTSMDDLPHVSDQAQKRDYPQFFKEMIEHGSHPRNLFSQGRSSSDLPPIPVPSAQVPKAPA